MIQLNVFKAGSMIHNYGQQQHRIIAREYISHFQMNKS